MKNFGEFGISGKKLEDVYKEKLEEISNKLEYEGQDNRKIEIIVYELDGITIRTEFKTKDRDYTIDLDTTNGKNISIKEEKLTDEGSDIKLFEIGKSTNNNMLTRTIKYTDMNQILEMNINSQNQEDQINVNVNASYKNNQIANLQIEGKTDFIISSNQVLLEEFSEKNNILLNNYEGDRIKSIIDDLKDRTIERLEDKQSKINTKLLNNILVWIDSKEQQIEEEEKSNEKTEKERFNNKFILYQGTDLEYEDVQNLINVVGQNMSDYEVISGNEIKIFIEEGKENKEKAEMIADTLSNKYKYNVKINYSDNGYVNSINISIYEK